jgi:dTDP-glucose pyrophosphorylase
MSGLGDRFIGAILAGGKGSRMGSISERYPKPLLPVANKPLMQHQIELMRDLGVCDILILIGHKGYEIARCFGDGSRLGVRIRYAEQTQALGIAHAAGRFEPLADRPMLMFLGDIFFVPGRLQDMFERFEAQGGGAVLAAKHEPDPRSVSKNFAMLLDDTGRVRRVIEKPRHPPNNLKGVGLYLFDLTVFDAIRRTHRTAMRDEYEITDSIQVMIDDGLPVSVSKCIVDDINVTTPDDLLACNLRLASEAEGGSLLGEGLHLAEGARIHQAVIGSHVRVQRPITVSNSLVFDHTCIDGMGNIHDAIVTPEGVYSCKPGDIRVSARP